MDRNVVTATVLIALIMVVWLTWLTPTPPTAAEVAAADSVASAQDQRAPEPESESESESEFAELSDPELPSVEALAADSTILGVTDGEVREITVVTDLYRARLSTQGATFSSFQLLEFRSAIDSSLVQMIDTTRLGASSIVFTTPSNRVYDTRSFVFDLNRTSDLVEVGDAPVELVFRVAVGEGVIEKRYRFENGSYEVGLDVELVDPGSFIASRGYDFMWNGAVPFSEIDHKQESEKSGAFARSGGEVESAIVFSDEYDEQSLRGQVDWIAVKNKYFTVAVIPGSEARGAELIAERFGADDDPDMQHVYEASLEMPFPTGVDSYRLYIGPIQLARLRVYDLALYDMVDYGWDFFETITRPLAKFVFIPIFHYLGRFMPYGLVIIVLSILIKLAVYPLTRSSFRSMAKMRELQPRMEAIKEKHADNPQKQQAAMMKMYKDTGVNPIGGCLPMLLQYPIIIALWQFLPQAIEIRQQGFLWATDLSAPDVILNLPFTIPLYGDFVSGFTLLMGISMVFQMRLQTTGQSNAQAKMFTYVFPVMIFVIFNRLAAGLNLYYLCYNVLSAAQQHFINKEVHAHPEELEKKAAPKKGAGRKALPKNGTKKGGKSVVAKRSSKKIGGKGGGRRG